MEERKSGGKCGYLLASPLAAAADFHGLPALAAAWENGSRSRINLLLAGRTQATAPSSPGPTRGAAPTPRFGGSERCEYRKHSSGLCRRWERGDGGVPGSGGFSERSLACSERTGPGGPAWVRASVLETAEPRGGAGSRKFATSTAPPRLEQPLVGKPGAGALAAVFDPQPYRGGSSPSRGWADAANQLKGTPAPSPPVLTGSRRPHNPRQAGASQSPRGPHSEGARLQPRLPGSGGGGIARRLQGGRPTEAPPARYSPGSTVTTVCKNRQAKP